MPTESPSTPPHHLPFRERAERLVGAMTIEEKIGQMMHTAPAIERLGIPSYNWWNEGLHGVARAGIATVFPQAIGLAATFDETLLHRVADAISTEARAKYHAFLREGERGYYAGITLWSPNVNIFRDPRWGRGHETYGEDPFLSGRMGVAFCRGLQGDDPRWLKTVATPKHFLAHSGPEALRHAFNARVSEQDLRATYMPAFEACIREGRAASIMGAYNRTNGEVCCGSRRFLQDVLRGEWGFDGYVVSDCGAIRDFHEHHKITPHAAASAALAVRHGCELNCGCVYAKLCEALEQGRIDEATIDRAVVRLFSARLALGMFDDPADVPYARIPYEAADSDEHRALARHAAAASIVLLKNDGLLPFRGPLRSLLVTGPNADSRLALLGNYHGRPSRPATVLDGIRAAVEPETRVAFCDGCTLTGRGRSDQSCVPGERISEAVLMARRADAVILVLGLDPTLEGEQGDASNADASGDRLDLDLPGFQTELLDALHATGKPLVVVSMSGSSVGLERAHEQARAVLQLWYPGQEGGHALADVLFGRRSPSGRLPVTFYRGVADLPPFEDYAMANRTYRYFSGTPLYPFGYGLGYARFRHEILDATPSPAPAGVPVEVRVRVTHVEGPAASACTQLTIEHPDAPFAVPVRELRGIRQTWLEPGAAADLTFTLQARDLALVDPDGRHVQPPGRILLYAGGTQPDARSTTLAGDHPASGELRIVPAPG